MKLVKQKGFTLVEAVIALITLFTVGLVVGVVGVLIHFIAKLW